MERDGGWADDIAYKRNGETGEITVSFRKVETLRLGKTTESPKRWT